MLAIFNNFRGSFCVSFNESIELMASIDKFEVLIKKKEFVLRSGEQARPK